MKLQQLPGGQKMERAIRSLRGAIQGIEGQGAARRLDYTIGKQRYSISCTLRKGGGGTGDEALVNIDGYEVYDTESNTILAASTERYSDSMDPHTISVWQNDGLIGVSRSENGTEMGVDAAVAAIDGMVAKIKKVGGKTK